jgi:lysophospholipase L1-like esterase
MVLHAAPPIRVMPVGDSITDGAGAPGGYRAPLYRLMTNAGYHVDFVGTQADNGAASLPDPDHEGHSGWRIDQIDTAIVGALAKVSDPDVILLLIGTNDYGLNYDPTNAIKRLEKLVAKIATNRPFAKIIVDSLLVRGEPYNTQIQTSFNPLLPALVERQRALGREVYFDDLRGSVALSDLPDQLHPGAVGYAKMAAHSFAAITNLFSPEGSQSAPGIARVYGWAGLTNLTVVFSKPIAEESAVPGNFQLSGGLVVTRAVLDAATQREVTLTTTEQAPATLYTVAATGVRDRTASRLEIAPGATAVFKSLAASGASHNVAEAAGYQLVYSLNIPDRPDYATGVDYTIDRHAEVSGFSRVAYYLELQQAGGPLNYVWVSMDAFTSDPGLIGVPTAGSGAFFQQPITNMNVQSSVAKLVAGTNLSGGNLEFWPVNSSPANLASVPNGSAAAYDWGDNPSPGNYGCMQVHNHAARQVLFAFNRWGGAGGVADLGMGNRSGNYLDWFLAQNADTYLVKTLQVFVLPAAPRLAIERAGLAGSASFSLRWSAQPGVTYSIYKKRAFDASAWVKIGETAAAANTAAFTDLEPVGDASYYRVAAP